MWFLAAIVVAVLYYVYGKIRYLMKRSEEQWRQVDKSKLRTWEDEED